MTLTSSEKARLPVTPTPRNRAGSSVVRSGSPFIAALMLLSASIADAHAQAGACKLVPEENSPQERVLRCGDALTVRVAHDTFYDLSHWEGAPPPKELPLDNGALMIEFHPSPGHRTFQIRTPNAIAAVRGTKWVVDVAAAKTSTFVIAGTVAVSRPQGTQTALLHPGDGADVSPDSGPIVVKRWAAPRVAALLARFGQR